MSKLKERRREIQGMDLVTAQEELKTLRRQLFDLRIQKERGEVKDTRQFAKTKNDIARMLYHIGELHHEAEMEAEGLGVGLGGAEPEGAAAAAETPATTTGKARATRASAARTSAPVGKSAGRTGATTTAPAATSAGAETSAATSATSVLLPATEEALSTPELPTPTSASEDQER